MWGTYCTLLPAIAQVLCRFAHLCDCFSAERRVGTDGGDNDDCQSCAGAEWGLCTECRLLPSRTQFNARCLLVRVHFFELAEAGSEFLLRGD